MFESKLNALIKAPVNAWTTLIWDMI